MFLIAAVNVLLSYPILSGDLGVIFSALLAAIAVIQLARGVKFLQPREVALGVVVLIFFGIAQVGHWMVATRPPSVYRGLDFSSYYVAARLISESPVQSPYYVPTHPDGRMELILPPPISSPWQAVAFRYHVPYSVPFIYPPFTAVLMHPLAHLSIRSAYIAWNIVTLLLLAASVLLSLSIGGVRLSWKLALILGVGLFSYYPLHQDLMLGQIDCMILFLIAAGIWLLSRNHTSLSALSYAIATMMKLTPLIAVPLLIFHRRWKWLGAYTAWMALILIFSVWQAGWQVHQQFWREVLPILSCGSPVTHNSSIVAYVQQLFLGYVHAGLGPPLVLPHLACAVSKAVAVAVYALMLIRPFWRRRESDLIRDLVIVILLGLAISPITWWYHYTVALLPFIYLWCRMPDKGNRILLALVLAVGTNILGFTLLLTQNHLAQLILAAIVPGMTIALVYLCLGRRRQPPHSGFISDPDTVATANAMS